MKYRSIVLSVAASTSLLLTGCSGMSGMTIPGITAVSQAALSQADITAGLKEALNIGVSMGIQKLAAKNGYYNDLAVKIGLPEEASMILANISKIPGGNQLVENVVKSINAAATDAVKDTAPIFAQAIKDMTFQDATSILKGNKTAATAYFKGKTKTALKGVFAKRIEASIQKKLIGDVSAQSSWNTLTEKWNVIAKNPVGVIAGFKPVNTDLTDYLTDKAVDGLYVKVGEQETKIRTQASARTTDLLKKVFGR
ncbi:MAG: DUF4197 domain-containing protein [Bacteroidales bacterium]|nr:DUF4197 domain-containing protein [Bacteroidales bacterium]